MKTIFDLGGIKTRSPWIGAVDTPVATVDRATRDEILDKLTPTLTKIKELGDLVQWSHNNDPWLKNFFGEDRGAFWLSWEFITQDRPTAERIVARMSKSDPSAWTELSEEEVRTVENLPPGVDAVYELYNERYKQMPSGKRPGTPSTAPTVPPPMPITPVKKSPVSQNVLIGGAIVAALGLLVYAATR